MGKSNKEELPIKVKNPEIEDVYGEEIKSPKQKNKTPPKLPPVSKEEEEMEEPESEYMDNIEKELAQHGYFIQHKIIVKDQEGEYAHYIKAINNNGQIVYILLDTDEKVRKQPDDLSVQKSYKVDVIPYSIKVGSLDCADLAVCGVAFECLNGICAMSRDQDFNPYETNFIISEDKGSLEGSPIAYPIVRYSDILENNREVSEIIDKTTKQIRNANYYYYMQELDKVGTNINTLKETFDDFYQKQSNAFNDLARTLKELEEIRNEYNDLSNLSEEDLKKYDTLIYNLVRRQELLTELLEISNDASQLNESLKSKIEHINEYSDYLDKQFSNIHYVMEP